MQQILLPNGSEIEINNTQFHPILFGGDQLLVARIRGTKVLRDTHDTPSERFEGIASTSCGRLACSYGSTEGKSR